jgi:hypothetical protein
MTVKTALPSRAEDETASELLCGTPSAPNQNRSRRASAPRSIQLILTQGYRGGHILGASESPWGDRRRRVRRQALTYMHQSAILMHMRTTLIIDDVLLDKARTLSGLNEKTAVVRAGLEALVARESARRLATLGGTEREMTAAPRRRSRAAR